MEVWMCHLTADTLALIVPFFQERGGQQEKRHV